VTITPTPDQFTVDITGNHWLAGVNPVTLSLGATATTTTLTSGELRSAQSTINLHDLTARFQQHLALLDRDELWRDLVAFKRLRRWWNVRFDQAAIDAALTSSRYRMVGLPAALTITGAADVERLNRLAATLLRRLFEEVDYDLLLRRQDAPDGTETALLGALLRDYLKPDAAGLFGGNVRKRRRIELLDYARKGRLGLGAEKAADMAGHPAPCEELWKRKQPFTVRQFFSGDRNSTLS
jgi:hypothetical protein